MDDSTPIVQPTKINFLTRGATTSEDRRLIKQVLLDALIHFDLSMLTDAERTAINLLVV